LIRKWGKQCQAFDKKQAKNLDSWWIQGYPNLALIKIFITNQLRVLWWLQVKIFDPGRVGSNFCCSSRVGSGRVSHLLSGFGKFPLKIPNFFRFKSTRGSWPGWLFIYCESKVCSGRVRSWPISNLYHFTITIKKHYPYNLVQYRLRQCWCKIITFTRVPA